MTKLYKILEKRGMSQSGLLRLIYNENDIGVPPQVLSALVTGKNIFNHNITTYLKIAKALKLTLNDVVEYELF